MEGFQYVFREKSEYKEMQNRNYALTKLARQLLSYYHSLDLLKIRHSISALLYEKQAEFLNEEINKSLAEIDKERETLPEQSGGDSDSEEYIEFWHRCDEAVERLTRLAMCNDLDKSVAYNLLKQQSSDFAKFLPPECKDIDLLAKIPDKNDTLVKFLVTAEVVYRFLSKRDDNENLDFSPALIPLTKALEWIFNEVFARLNASDIAKNVRSCSYYLETYNRQCVKDANGNYIKKKAIEFGPCVNLLSNNNFSAFNVEKSIKVEKLSSIKAIKSNNADDTDVGIQIVFDTNVDRNRRILYEELIAIKDNYRNKVAHSERIQLQRADECRKIMFTTKNILWILLYIIDLDEQSTI